MLEWQRERERKLNDRRAAKEEPEQLALRAAPVISKRSEALVEAARRRKAPSSGDDSGTSAADGGGSVDDDVGTATRHDAHWAEATPD